MIGPPLDSARSRALPGRPGSARRVERGMTWVSLLLLVAVVGGAYLAWVWAPVYFDHYTVKQVVRDYQNQAIKNRDDDQLRHDMVLKIRSLRQRDEIDAYGRAVQVPSVHLEDHHVSWERDTRSQPPMLRVSFEYAREVAYPLLGRTTTKVFAVDLSNELKTPDWGPQR
ncbi:MAG TPA: hypothetical protein VFL83_16305 [Anaeromyxobacter sp.]|nr:hypothetical protein [Anaeromyxobacter sp.]